MRKLFFVGMLLASLFCGTSVLLAKEDGTEDCDAVALERVLEQARVVLANTDFLRELKPTTDDAKKIVGAVIADIPVEDEDEYESSKKEYDESIRRFWAKSGQPKK